MLGAPLQLEIRSYSEDQAKAWICFLSFELSGPLVVMNCVVHMLYPSSPSETIGRSWSAMPLFVHRRGSRYLSCAECTLERIRGNSPDAYIARLVVVSFPGH